MPANYSIIFVAWHLTFGYSIATSEANQGLKTPEQLLDLYVRSWGEYYGGANPPQDVIVALAAKLNSSSPDFTKTQLMRAMAIALSRIPATEQVKQIGRGALYRELENDDPAVRSTAVGTVARMDKAASTEALLKRIDDPDSHVRVVTLEALADSGDPNRVEAVEQALENRAKHLSSTELRDDYSLEVGSRAVERLKQRAKYPDSEFHPLSYGPSPPWPKGTLASPLNSANLHGLPEGAMPPVNSRQDSAVQPQVLQSPPTLPAGARLPAGEVESKVSRVPTRTAIIAIISIATLTTIVVVYFRRIRRQSS